MLLARAVNPVIAGTLIAPADDAWRAVIILSRSFAKGTGLLVRH